MAGGQERQAATMAICEFLVALINHGRVEVGSPAHWQDAELQAVDQILADFEQNYRLELPGEPPPYVASAGKWAAMKFYRACQFAVYRDIPVSAIHEELTDAPTDKRGPEVHYSVDLVFRFLPDLEKFARSAAERDPLLDRLRKWGQRWPLSSVGLADVGDVSSEGFREDASLMSLYADRILATNDLARLADPSARAAVMCALGRHTDLAPRVAKALVDMNVPSK